MPGMIKSTHEVEYRMKTSVSKGAVFNQIIKEREYQDSQREAGRFTEEVLPLPGELVCLQYYLNKALDKYISLPGEAPTPSLHELRKVVAIGVRALEHHGCPEREALESPITKWPLTDYVDSPGEATFGQTPATINSFSQVDFRNGSGLEFVDISSELRRRYVFPDAYTVEIDLPLYFQVSPSGGHRIFDAHGTSHYVPKGWVHLSWETKPGAPHFVK